MGLQLAKTLSTGVTANYWRITRISLDVVRHLLIVDLGLYTSQTDRGAGKMMVDSYTYIFDASALPLTLTGETPGASVYTAIKALIDFTGAIDC